MGPCQFILVSLRSLLYSAGAYFGAVGSIGQLSASKVGTTGLHWGPLGTTLQFSASMFGTTGLHWGPLGSTLPFLAAMFRATGLRAHSPVFGRQVWRHWPPLDSFLYHFVTIWYPFGTL